MASFGFPLRNATIGKKPDRSRRHAPADGGVAVGREANHGGAWTRTERDVQQGVARADLSYTYNAAGQLTEASDPAATYDNAYDGLGRVTAETQTIDGLSSTIEYDSQYDAGGNRTDLQALLDTTDVLPNNHPPIARRPPP